jgi:hypothetical protein
LKGGLKMKFDKQKIMEAINDCDLGCKREGVIKIFEAVIKEELEEKVKYPCLMKGTGRYDDEIILVVAKGYEGFHLNGEGGNHYIGKQSTHWREDAFKPFSGKVILQNKDGKLDVEVSE